MTLIKTIPPEEAEGRLETIYNRIKGPDGRVDNILVAHSLRPLTLEAHMAMYKYVLHYGGNETPKWFLEAIGVFVSMLNECDYCVAHHCEGLRKLLKDDDVARAMRSALAAGADGKQMKAPRLGEKEIAALVYVRKLTRTPGDIGEADIKALHAAGWDDGTILEVNQVASYFAYANRTVLGLGVSTDGDALGLSPCGGDPNDWGHR